ncbi:Phosphocarrier protein HPr [bioreactor metagenome]|uniref:Phosphocarrier protein HPr n=1 Tax=bioreactor metagenome TaxID=1076179 RepID=A0A645DUE5_9ZZZZ
MISSQVTIMNSTGLHARPASVFVASAKQFVSRITIRNASGDEYKPVNAKSIVLLLTLGLTQGTPAEITAEGEDEVAAMETLTKLIASGLGE